MRTIDVPGYARDNATMSGERSQERAILSVPQVHTAIIAATRQLSSIWAPGHTSDARRVRFSNPAANAFDDIPYLHPTLKTHTCQHASIWVPGNALEKRVVAIWVVELIQTGA